MTGTSPARSLLTVIFAVALCSAGGLASNAAVGQYSSGQARVVFADDFSSGGAGWGVDNGVWAIGAASSGPGACHGGTQCAGTVLDGNYPYTTDSRLIGPQLQLPALAAGEELLLRFRQYWSYGSADRGEVQIQVLENDTWSEWTTLKRVSGYYTPDWHHARVDLRAYAGQRVRLGFLHLDGTERNGYGANVHAEAAGWYLDAVEITVQPIAQLTALEDFEAGWGQWYSDNGVWAVGAASSGPGACHGGTQCAGTVLDGNYPYTTDSRLIGPQLQLPALAAGEELLLRFRQYWSYGSADRGEVQIQVFENDTWSEWTTLKSVSGYYTPDWHHARVALSAYAGQRVRLGFLHLDGTERNGYGANVHAEAAGWYLDAVEITVQPIAQLTALEDFEAGWGQWYSDNGVWAVGAASSGPGTCHGGTQCAGTVLDGNYPYTTDSRLIGPQLQLPALAAGEELLLRFRQYWSYGSADRGEVQIQVFENDTWSEWTTLKSVSGYYTPDWHHARVALSAYAGQRVRLGFLHLDGTERNGYGANVHAEAAGWYLDAVEITVQPIAQLTALEDFEAGWGQWYSDNGVWAVGAASSGPGACHGGTQCAGTVLDGNYPYTTDSRLIGPQLQLPALAAGEELLLRFRQYWSYGSADRGEVQIQVFENDTWSEWTTLKSVSGYYTPDWHHARVALSAYAGQRVRLGFLHLDGTERNGYGANVHAEAAGWYLDDIEISMAAAAPPSIQSSPDLTMLEGASLTVPLTATDIDGGPLTFTVAGIPDFATLTDAGDGTANIRFDPPFDAAGSYRLRAAVSDGRYTASESFVLTVANVNRPPSLEPIPPQATNEQASAEILLAAGDPDGDPLTLGVFGLPTFATFLDHGDGTGIIRLAPGSEDGGSYLVSITVHDASASDSVSFALSVGEVNQAPRLTVPDARALHAGNTLVVPIKATDPDGGALVLAVTDLPPFAVLTDHGDGNGALTFTATAGSAGLYPMTIEVSDGQLSDSSSFILTVDDSNPPNLIVSALTHPQEGWTGQPIDLGWTLTNAALSTATGTWQDCVYLSGDGNAGGDTLLGCLGRPTDLDANQTYARILTAHLPDVPDGNYWVLVRGDDGNVVMEANENDNLAVAGPFAIHKIACADVQPGSVQLAVTRVGAGGTAAVSWSVGNDGDGATNAPVWTDRVYLSADSSLGPGDRKVADVTNPMALGSRETYTRSTPFSVPGHFVGDYYVLVQADAGARLAECDEGNNVAVSAGTLQIEQSLEANLTVRDVRVVPAEPWPDDTVTVTWTLLNTGDTPTGRVTLDHALVLSDDPDLDPAVDADRVLRWHVASHTANLAAGESSQTLSATVRIPRDTWGDRHLIVWPDAPGRTGVQTFVASAAIAIREPLVADLIVDQVTAPVSGLSGQPLPVTWTVRNVANNLTLADGWRDVVILSRDADPATGADNQPLGSMVHGGALDFDGTYTATHPVNLPDAASGAYWLFVCTDAANQVFEGTQGDANNCTAASEPLIATFQPADLEVESARITAQGQPAVLVLSGTPIAVDWQVHNTGAGATSATAWRDALYLSVDANLDPSDRLLAQVSRGSGLDPAGGYPTARSVTLPLDFHAPAAHLIVCTDTSQQVFEADETNNCRATNPLEVRWGAADLVVSQLDLPPTAGSTLSGTAVSLNWEVRNQGPGATSAGHWSDAIYLSADPLLDGSDLRLASAPHVGGLGTTSAYAASHPVTIPATYAGPIAHLIVCAAAAEQVVETDRDNNCTASAPITITWAPANLAVAAVAVRIAGKTAVSVASGTAMMVQWQTENHGPGATDTGTWSDRIYLSSDDVLDDQDPVLATITRNGILSNQDGYAATTEVAIPVDFTAPAARIFVRTDRADEVYESDDADNVTASAPFQVPWGAPDLAVAALFAEHGVPRGETVDLTWTVRNRGGPTGVAEWNDRIFHSADRWLSPDDAELMPQTGPSSTHLGALTHGQSYTRRERIGMPAGTTGYLIVSADAIAPGVVIESDERNNSAHTALPALDCDSELLLSAVDAPATAISGQLMNVAWTVANEGAQATNAGSWRDAVYLSRDQYLDPDTDIYVGARARDGALAGGDHYALPATLEVRVPVGLTGPYYVFVITDRDDVVCETVETDNAGFHGVAVDVELPPPTDLVVTQILTPLPAQLGDDLLLEWTVRNVGDFDARGIWHDAVYLSEDIRWDAADHKLGEVRRSGALAPQNDYSASLSATLAGVVAGRYYVLVRTDSRAEVREAGDGEQNNVAAASESFEVDAADLALDVPETGHTLTTGNEQIFRIAGVPAGEDLLLKLDAASDGTFTELYLSHEVVPGRGRHDHASAAPFTADQEIVLSGTQAGDYYVLVRATSVADPPAAYTLSASLLPFELREVSTTTLGNDGAVTIHIEGSQFTPGTRLRLVDDVGATIATATPMVASSTRMAATFELTGAAAGTYQLQADTAAGRVVSLGQPLQVVSGSGPTLTARLIVPPNVRPGREYTYWIEYENTGTTDMLAPLFSVSALPVDAFNVVIPSLATPQRRLTQVIGQTAQALGISFDGPAGILPPNARYRIPVRFRVPNAGASIRFTLSTMVDDDTVIDWAALAPGAPPALYPDHWAAIWRNFTLQNQTTHDYLRSLSEAATHLARDGARVSDVFTIGALVVQRAAGEFTLRRILASAVDAASPAQGLPLLFSRVALDALGQRFSPGPLGRGWSHSYEYALSFPDATTANIRLPGGAVRSFILGDGAWSAGAGDHAQFRSLPDGSFRLLEKEGLSLTFDSSGRLAAMAGPNGNRIALAYVGGRLTEVNHVSGRSLVLAYDPRGRIVHLTDDAGRVTDYHYDERGERLVRVEAPGAQVTRYAYVPETGTGADHALASVANPDGTHRAYAYDTYGRLIRQTAGGGAEPLAFDYPSLGYIHTTDALGATYRLRLDSRGELLQAVDPQGQVLELAYDENRNLTTLTQTSGERYRFTYDGRGNLTSRIDPMRNRVDFTYAASLGRLSTMRDARGNSTAHEYDSRGNLVSIAAPDHSAETFAYDQTGNVVEWRNRRGQAIRVSYDDRGLPTRKTYPDGSTVTYAYDARGNLISADDTDGAITLQYDDTDRLVRIAYPSGRFLAYAYDVAGRRTHLVDQDGFGLNYQYDSLGRLAGLLDTAGKQIMRYTYDAVGRLVREDKGNGTYTTYSRDEVGQVLRLLNHAPDGTIQSRFDYTYDALGRRATMATLEGAWSYRYDALGQLTRAVFGSTTAGLADLDLHYVYDAAGNRVQVVANEETTDYVANARNQYTQVGPAIYEYDADGNLLAVLDPTRPRSHAFNSENRLTSTVIAGARRRYEYDALGGLAAFTVDGKRVEHLRDPSGFGDLIGEYDSAGQIVARYRHGFALLSRQTAGDGDVYFDHDATTNVTAVTDSTGHTLNQYAYLPFGGQLARIEATPSDLRFSGQNGVTHEGDDAYLMRARLYLARTGRFVSEDPLLVSPATLVARYLDEPNRYTYALNDPISRVDPLGLMYLEAPGYLIGSRYLGEALRYVGGALRFAGGALRFKALLNGPLISELGTMALNATRFAGIPGHAGPMWAGPRFVGPSASFFYSWYLGKIIADASVAVGDWLGNYIYDTLPAGYRDPLGEWIVDILYPIDPNDKVGPAASSAGVSASGDSSGAAMHAYRINFENLPEAGAPAVRVLIADQLDAAFDLRTLQLEEIAFGQTVVQVPGRRSNFTGGIDVGDNLVVRIDAGLDIETRTLTWTLTAIDPATGEMPADPTAGFLPPNDPATGSGEGRVTFSVRPLPSVLTGTEIINTASIVFDTNEPIVTNEVFNTVDAGVPSSAVQMLPATLAATQFVLGWEGEDDPGGSGVASYDIYVSDNGRPYEPWLTRTAETSGTFTGRLGHVYRFYSVARDHVGHVEAAPADPDATTTVLILSAVEDDDGDGSPTAWEARWGTDPVVHDALDDRDGDGLVNGDEYRLGTDPLNASSVAPGPYGESFALFRDHFDDGRFADRWVLAALDARTEFALSEAGTELALSMQRPANGCTEHRLQSFATVAAVTAVFRSTLHLAGHGVIAIGLMSDPDLENRVEVHLDTDRAPQLRLRSWNAGVLTEVPVAAPFAARGATVVLDLVKTGADLVLYANGQQQAATRSAGLGTTGLRPYLVQRSCADDAGDANARVDAVELLRDTDGDRWPDRDDNCRVAANVGQLDTDGDGAGDVCDDDDDGDGLSDAYEIDVLGSNPLATDSDADGLMDGEENDTDPVRADVRLHLVAGANFIAFPISPRSELDSAAFLHSFAADPMSIGRYDRVVGSWESTAKAAGSISGAVFSLQAGEGYVVRTGAPESVRFEGAPIAASAVDLEVGFNLVGVGNGALRMDATRLLEWLGGPDAVASIARLDPVTGRFQVVAHAGAATVGNNFEIRRAQAYIIQAHQAIGHPGRP